ncbi:hypothetical protein E4U61_006122 [Claviceps capensis]|nr:hypothetical protein E4U61_006122 [Claviceps capensis]
MGYQDQQHHHQPTAEAAAHVSHASHAGGGAGGGPDDVRPTHVFTGYLSQAYPDNSNSPSGPTPPHHLVAPPRTGSATAIASTVITAPVPRRKHHRPEVETPEGLFPNLPEAKKRKFILVDDSVRGSRLRVRVTLDGVDTNEIPDSFRRSASVFPRSYFPREMQSPPPSPTGRRFFWNDLPDEGRDEEETEGRGLGRRVGGSGSSSSQAVDLAMSMGMGGRDGSSCHPGAAALGVHRMRKSRRGREIKLNDLAGRMAWLQSRVFAGRPVFLQRALDTYRNRTKAAIESTMQDVSAVAPHFETRAGKRRWNARREASEE